MDTPFRPSDGQRWLPFKNVGDKTIPAFGVLTASSEKSKVAPTTVTGVSEIDGSYVLRGQSTNASNVLELYQDAGSVFLNSEMPVKPDGFGRCTQDYPAMALIRVDKELRPGVFVGYGSSEDRDSTKYKHFALELGGGAFRFLGFDGCPETQYKDPASPGVKFRVGLVTAAYKDLAPRFGAIGTATTIEGHSLMSIADAHRVDGSAFDFDPAYSGVISGTGANLIAGFKLRAQGAYIVSASATVSSNDAPAGALIGFTVLTDRAGFTEAERAQLTDLADLPTGTGPSGVGASLGGISSIPLYTSQKVDTQLYHTENEDAEIYYRETQEKYRFKSQVAGTSIFTAFAGDSIVIANQTPYSVLAQNLRFIIHSIPTRGYAVNFFSRIAEESAHGG